MILAQKVVLKPKMQQELNGRKQGTMDTKKPPASLKKSRVLNLVAGARFELTTFRL